MKIKKIYFWASDFASNSGEGKLARFFLKNISNKRGFKVIKIKSKYIKSNKNTYNQKNNLIHNYLGPLIGILHLWRLYLLDKKICYINYLPLWNFIIFLILPPNCILGPISGSIDSSRHFFLKNFFEFISILIIKFRYKKVIFSNNFYQTKIKNALSNFILYNLKFDKIKKNKSIKYDFVFYNRKSYSEKKFFKLLIIKLVKMNYKVVVAGDPIEIEKVFNLGYVSHKKLISVIKKSKFAVSNRENLYSFFTQDCLKNNLIVFYNHLFKKYEKYNFNNFYSLNYLNHTIASKQILKKINNTLKKNNFSPPNFDYYFEDL